jgi:hypothetical protein
MMVVVSVGVSVAVRRLGTFVVVRFVVVHVIADGAGEEILQPRAGADALGKNEQRRREKRYPQSQSRHAPPAHEPQNS